ncbi:MAG: sigma-70 family RNA polymerase sigma factor [Flavobacteriales bacterium]|nr:sigma-70 family RNA polymerase sigma factor [Flavobacteriales bacterium]MCB9448392.1 sigma-70 family RNA polymerase sigma factor [Flavobacteriales bacterium]
MKATMTLTAKYHMTAVDIEAESHLVAAAREDIRNFEPLYRKYYDAIFRFVFRRCDAMETATDVTAEVFYKAMTRIHQYKDRGLPFSAWLYRIALNEMNTNFRKKSRHRIISIDDDSRLVTLAAEAGSEADDRMYAMLQIIKSLNGEATWLIEMRYFEERPFKEIADILGTTEAAVKMKMQRILQRIRKECAKLTTKQPS